MAFEDPYRKYVNGERRVCVLSEYICTMFSLFECMFLKLYGDIHQSTLKNQMEKNRSNSIARSVRYRINVPYLCVFLFFRELQAMFKVKDVPTVVVLRPDGSVLSPDVVQDICRFGSNCFQDWQESAELIERSFMLNEEFDNLNLRSATDPVRRLKYKTEDDKRKKRWWKLWGKGKTGNEEDDDNDGTWDTKKKEGNKGVWRKR